MLHYWPLSVGAQFYLVWPALLAAVFIAARARRQRGIVWAAHQGLLVVASIVVVVSFGWALYQSATDPNSAYFSSLTRVWELGIGALVAIAGPWLAVIPDSRRPLLAYAGLAGVAASLFLITPHVQFPAPWAALPVLSTALVAASFHGATVQAMPLLTNPVARWLGDTSYPLYLWHWPVIVLLASRMPRGPVYFAVVIALALGVAAITYRFYEKPIRESKWLSDDIVPVPGSRRPYLTPLGWALGGAVAASLVVFAIANMSYKNTIVNAQQAATAADKGTNDRPTAGGSLDPCLGAPAMVTKGCALRNPDVPLSPPVNQLAQDDLQSELIGCYRSGEMKGDVPSCDYGYGGPDAKRIAFIGDSHAAALMPALLPILDANRWRLTTYLGNQCELSDPPPDGCADAMPGIRAELAAKKYDLVLTTNFSKSSPVAGYRKALEAIAAGGSRIAVVADNPQTSQAAIACVTRSGGDKKGGCGTPRAEALAVPDSLVAAAKGIPGGTVIDMTRFYCDAGRCPSVIGDVIVYRDVKAGGNTFITKSFAGTLAPALEEGLRSALAAQGTEKNAASTPASPSSKPGG